MAVAPRLVGPAKLWCSAGTSVRQLENTLPRRWGGIGRSHRSSGMPSPNQGTSTVASPPALHPTAAGPTLVLPNKPRRRSRRRMTLRRAGCVTAVICLLIAFTNILWEGVFIGGVILPRGRRERDGENGSSGGSEGFDFGWHPRSRGETSPPHGSNKVGTVLLVALASGEGGKAALRAWSDFVLAERYPQQRPGEGKEGEKQEGSLARERSETHRRRRRRLSVGGGAGAGEGRFQSRKKEVARPPSSSSSPSFPTVWVLTSDPSLDEAVRSWMPHLLSFFVPKAAAAADSGGGEATSPRWIDVIESFLLANEGVDVFGVFGEGTLPSPGLGKVVETLRPVLASSVPPTAVLSRSRWDDGVRERVGKREWLPDKLLAQVWFNRAMLAASRRKGAGLHDERVEGLTMLQVLRRLVRDPVSLGALLVDGTNVVESTHARSRRPFPPFEAVAAAAVDARAEAGNHWERDRPSRGGPGDDPAPPPLGETSSTWWLEQNKEEGKAWGDDFFFGGGFPDGLAGSYYGRGGWAKQDSCEEGEPGDVYIGNVDHTLVFGEEKGAAALRGATGAGSGSGSDGSGYAIVEASWPRRYILDGVADADTGLVVVTSVNCGYLDMAANFLVSVRRHSDVQILFVAMDEVSFDYVDAMAPGTAVLFSEGGSRRHAVGAGQWGDSIFKAETLVRPDILMSLLKQGHKVLWTDVDMVWLGNPLGLLPDVRKDASAAEIMLQIDGKPINKCTCFMYLDATPSVMQLIELWKDEIIKTKVDQNQMAFQWPLVQMESVGLRLDILPDEVMPPGFKFFNETYMEEHHDRYKDKLLIVHNNWVIGHEPKKQRFREYGLWQVEGWEFPSCQKKRTLSWEEEQGDALREVWLGAGHKTYS